MAVKQITYSRQIINYDEELAISQEARDRFGYKYITEAELEGKDGSQKYSFAFLSSIRNAKGGYISYVRIRKCGDEKVIQNECDLEKFLKKAGFVPKTSE